MTPEEAKKIYSIDGSGLSNEGWEAKGFLEGIEYERKRAEKLAKTLTSISLNSCCKPCREAGLWAKKALAEWEKNK
jgi:hypothetical protein